MEVPTEFSRALAEFPPPLRELVEAELSSGNAITAIEHGFPAAPCGASIRLAKAVTLERRRSLGQVQFYARNNANYAGEFTTESRHFFVLEPPLPPEPAPDMQAIRQALQAKPDELTHFAQTRVPGSLPAIPADRMHDCEIKPQFKPEVINKVTPDTPPQNALTTRETATGVTRLLHFQDQRPPHEIQSALERDLMTLFTASMVNGQLTLNATAKVVGAAYDFELRFESALPQSNAYSLRVTTSWAALPATHHDYYRKTSDSWFSLWTREFMPADPLPDAFRNSRYDEICAKSLNAEAHLNTVAAIQQAILDEMRRGGSFSTSHKEGGTRIYWHNGRFHRSDYGVYPRERRFTRDSTFLKILHQLYEWETSRNTDLKPVPEFTVWKLIWRMLRKP